MLNIPLITVLVPKDATNELINNLHDRALEKGIIDIQPIDEDTRYNSHFTWKVDNSVRLLTDSWEQKIKSLLGYFADDIVNFRFSFNCLRNYFALSDALIFPDPYPVVSKEWLHIVGERDSSLSWSQWVQGINYYLGLAMRTTVYQSHRSLPIFDIKITHKNIHPLTYNASNATRNNLAQKAANLANSIYSGRKFLSANSILDEESQVANEIKKLTCINQLK